MKLNIVAARTGLTWVRTGIRTFLRQPLGLTGLFALLLLLVSTAAVIPLVGALLTQGLLPFMAVGMLAATHACATTPVGQRPRVMAVAFRAMASRPRPLAVLGAWCVVGLLLLLAVGALLDGGQFAQLYLLGGDIGKGLEQPAVQRAMWATSLLYAPLSMVFWLAAALVHGWHVAPGKGLFFAAVACWRNFAAFTVFGIAWFGAMLAVSLAAGLVIGLVVGLLGTSSAATGALAGGLALGCALAVAVMSLCSLYFSFRDCFEPTGEETQP
jgi:hypothetical protein